MQVKVPHARGLVHWALIAALVVGNVIFFLYVRDDVMASRPNGLGSVASPAASPAPSPAVTPAWAMVGPEDGPQALVITGEGPVLMSAAERLPWRAEVIVTPTSAFTSLDGSRPGDLMKVVRERESLEKYKHIVIQGGAGNADTDSDVLRVALLHLLDEVSAKLGSGATITLMGPVPESPGDRVPGVDRALRDAVQDRGIVYIDPERNRWSLEDADLVDDVTEALAGATRQTPLVAQRPPSSTRTASTTLDRLPLAPA